MVRFARMLRTYGGVRSLRTCPVPPVPFFLGIALTPRDCDLQYRMLDGTGTRGCWRFSYLLGGFRVNAAFRAAFIPRHYYCSPDLLFAL